MRDSAKQERFKGEVVAMNRFGLMKENKFYITRHTLFWAILCATLSILIYVGMLIIIGDLTQKEETVTYGYYVVRDVSLVIATILITTILTGLLVETRTKNELYHDTIFSDVISNPLFYNAFSDEIQREMLNALEKAREFPGSPKVQEMYDSIKNKLSQAEVSGYYWTEASFILSCSVDAARKVFVKQCSRTIKVRSYKDTHSVRGFLLLDWSGIDIEDCFTLNSIKINGKQVDMKDCPEIQSNHADSISGFTKSYTYKYLPELHLYANQDTVIVASYTSLSPLSHNAFLYRCSAPCKRLSVEAALQGIAEYKLTAAAFGFRDSAEFSTAQLNKQQIHIQFDDWVFDRDGVVIVCTPIDKDNTEGDFAGKSP